MIYFLNYTSEIRDSSLPPTTVLWDRPQAPTGPYRPLYD